MKILYANMLEPVSVKGHKNLDKKLIQFLSEFSFVSVVCPKLWYGNLPVHVKEYAITRELKTSGKIEYYRHSLKIINTISALDKRKKYDYIIFGSIDVYMTAYAIMKIRESASRIFVIHHDDMDKIEKIWKARIFFRIYCKIINHITLDEFIFSYLISKYKLDPDKCSFIPHPMCNKQKEVLKKRQFDCVGISNSNEEKWIWNLLELEKKEAWFQNREIKVVLRSRTVEYDDGFLKIIREYLSDEDYAYYYGNAKSVILPFPDSFQYRMSGSLVDSLSNYSVVAGSNIPMIDWFSKKYPVICKKMESTTDFLFFLENKEFCVDESAFCDFINEHSDEQVINKLKIMIWAHLNTKQCL